MCLLHQKDVGTPTRLLSHRIASFLELLIAKALASLGQLTVV